jgi:hypothetical protein
VFGATFNPYHWVLGQALSVRLEGTSADVRIVGSCYCFLGLAMDWSTYAAAVPGTQPTDYLVQLKLGTDANPYVTRISAAEPNFLLPR